VSGQVFGFFTSNGLSATPRSIPGAPNKGLSYSLYDAGFGIGGPIVKDRLWYSGAYNPSISSEDVVIPGWGSYQDRRHIHSFAAKLTWRADARNTFVLTGLGDPTTGRRVSPPVNRPAGIDPFLSDVREGGVAGIVEGRHVMRDHLLLQTSLSRSYRAENQTPETELGRTADFFIDSAGVASGGGFRQKNESGVTTASLHATWLGRDQEVKAGIEYRDTRLDFDTRYVILAQASATSYYYQLASFKGHVGSRLPSAFLQHSWHPTERITVSDGMRWEGEHWISSQGRVAQTILDEWQPRIGLTYQPGRLGTQKVEGSFGRYYQSITTAPLFWYYNANSLFYSASYDHDPRVDPAGADTIGYGGGAIQPRLIGLQGQFFDEFALGYELQIGSRMKFSVRGIERILRKGIEDGIDLQTFAIGLSNPGLGVLHAFPAMTRRYSAIELSWLGQIGKDVSLLGSYVLSRNFGNHEGLFDSRLNNPYPNATGLYDVLDQMANSSGLLPNDRTHVFKLAGSYRAGGGVTLGWAGLVESGMPVSEFGGTAVGPPYGGFIGARGSHGRTPAIWDLNLRLGYEPRFAAGGRFHPALTVDGLHVASQRRAVRYDEVHYRTLDSSGNESDPNPNYRTPTAFQPPMEIRLGLELSF